MGTATVVDADRLNREDDDVAEQLSDSDAERPDWSPADEPQKSQTFHEQTTEGDYSNLLKGNIDYSDAGTSKYRVVNVNIDEMSLLDKLVWIEHKQKQLSHFYPQYDFTSLWHIMSAELEDLTVERLKKEAPVSGRASSSSKDNIP